MTAPKIPRDFLKAAERAKLSERQTQILYLAATGKTLKDAASVLGISLSTASDYSFRARVKLNAPSIASAVFLLAI